MTNADTKTSVATFAAGCFWSVEETFRQVKGVVDVVVGYTGGTTLHPTYEQVCTGTTGHAEAVRVSYNPLVVSYQELLWVFFEHHTPTTKNRQGPDIGHQYRSAIFYHTDSERQKAEKIITELTNKKRFSGRMVTELVPAEVFWRAEEYHQHYLQKHSLAVCPA